MLISHLDIRNSENFVATMTINQVMSALGLDKDGFEPRPNDWQNPWGFAWEFQECSWQDQGILLERPLGSQDNENINEIVFFNSEKEEEFWNHYLQTGEGDAGLSWLNDFRVESYGQLPAEVLAKLVAYCLDNDLRFALEVRE